jgi:hypothetical protein
VHEHKRRVKRLFVGNVDGDALFDCSLDGCRRDRESPQVDSRFVSVISCADARPGCARRSPRRF